jgi:hypothetical protein
LDLKISQQKAQIEDFDSYCLTSHYKKYNVDRRDATSKANSSKLCVMNKKIEQLEKDNADMLAKLECSEKQITDLNNENKQLREQLAKVETQVVGKKRKKLKAQKRASYERTAKTPESVVQTKRLKQEMKFAEADREVFRDIQNTGDLEVPKSKLNLKVNSKEYGISSRMCIMTLTGLEIAAQKIPSVIQCVAEDIFNTKLDFSELPSRTAVQNIVDQSHYVAKRFLAEKLDKANFWGTATDGTARRKQKILDTSVAVSTGDIYSLGFTPSRK